MYIKYTYTRLSNFWYISEMTALENLIFRYIRVYSFGEAQLNYNLFALFTSCTHGSKTYAIGQVVVSVLGFLPPCIPVFVYGKRLTFVFVGRLAKF